MSKVLASLPVGEKVGIAFSGGLDTAVAVVNNEENDPALFVRDATHRDTENRMIFVGDDRVVCTARRQNLGQRVDGLETCSTRFFPQHQKRVGIDRLKVPVSR